MALPVHPDIFSTCADSPHYCSRRPFRQSATSEPWRGRLSAEPGISHHSGQSGNQSIARREGCPSLLDVPEKIDIVDIFRRPEFVEEVVDQAIQLKVPAVWMQEEIVHEKAAQKARAAGIFVVMDRCPGRAPRALRLV